MSKCTNVKPKLFLSPPRIQTLHLNSFLGKLISCGETSHHGFWLSDTVELKHSLFLTTADGCMPVSCLGLIRGHLVTKVEMGRLKNETTIFNMARYINHSFTFSVASQMQHP